MKILLMSVKAGYGHHSTAKAIIEYFEKNGHECEMLDIFDYINHRLGNSIQDGYLVSTKYLPKTYGKAYGKLSQKDEPYDKHSLMSLFSRFVSKRLEKFVKKYSPDLIIGTHSYAGVCMSLLENKGVIDCPTIGIVTDFTVHPFWESTFLDYYVIPDKLISSEMRKKGITQEKLLPIGIPVRSQFSVKTDKKEARKLLGIKDIPTVLIIMGSMGYGNIKSLLEEMDVNEHDFQILCVCGSNKKIKSAVDEFEWTKKVYSYGFVDNVDVMMDAADFIISKPGGLTTSEALAKGLPMVILNPIPGQEDRNLNFLVNSGAAITVNEDYRIGDALNLMFGCPWRTELMRESIKHLGKPDAAKNLYEFSMEKVEAKSTVI
ncbi:MAG: glycosyltransferase [Oscillospiraceae bacterium]|nr:glycosyltransferase [Oscillospiraceae bacterium]